MKERIDLLESQLAKLASNQLRLADALNKVTVQVNNTTKAVQILIDMKDEEQKKKAKQLKAFSVVPIDPNNAA